MAATFQVIFEGTAADAGLYDALTSLEVEENLELPGAFQLNLSVNQTEDGELDFPGDARLRPLANVAVVVTMEDRPAECVFDGYVLSHKLHLEVGATGGTLQVWGQDSTWLMNLEEKTREWSDVTDAQVAKSIFQTHGIDPASANTDEDSASHTEDNHTLMQRGSDIQFLSTLARRSGKLCRVFCTDKPGKRTGWFAKPDLGQEPVLTLNLADLESWTADALDLEWDVTRPTRVVAGQALFNDEDPGAADRDLSDSGLTLLDSVGLSKFAGKDMTVLLAAPVDDAGELRLRAQSLLREAGWFVRCETEVDAGRCGRVLRAGQIVQIEQLGSIHSGKYLVWSVRHVIDDDSHRMRLVLARNAVGKAPGSGLADAAGALAGALAGAFG
jgi:hypothetical protein